MPSVQLAGPDRRQLVGIVQALPTFVDPTGRRRLLEAALAGEPRADRVLGLIDLSGAPRDVAVAVVSELERFGQVAYGRPALGVFLNELLLRSGDPEDEAFLRSLFQRYPLEGQAAPQGTPDAWRGGETADEVQEKIIGENTLRDVVVLAKALEAARAVVRLAVPPYVGTGFLVAPGLMMTNHHVIGSPDEAARTQVWFRYQLGLDGLPEATQAATCAPDRAFFTDADLDVTVVAIEGAPEDVAPLRLSRGLPEVDDRVAIIQHPGGNLKKISMQNNFVAYADATILQYTTSTEPGSSGAPVFDDDFGVVAIHHSGGMLAEPGSGRRYLRNAGTTMRAALAAIEGEAPELAARVAG